MVMTRVNSICYKFICIYTPVQVCEFYLRFVDFTHCTLLFNGDFHSVIMFTILTTIVDDSRYGHYSFETVSLMSSQFIIVIFTIKSFVCSYNK